MMEFCFLPKIPKKLFSEHDRNHIVEIQIKNYEQRDVHKIFD